MTRQEIEQKAYDILTGSMEYIGTDDFYIWQEIKKTDTETLKRFIEEE